MDILVEFSAPSAAIAIENKIFAAEQDKQVADYAEHLARMYEHFYIVFLSPSGHLPTHLSKRLHELRCQGRLVPVAYATKIADWLKKCRCITDSEKLRYFLEDFHDYVVMTLDHEGSE